MTTGAALHLTSLLVVGCAISHGGVVLTQYGLIIAVLRNNGVSSGPCVYLSND